MALNILGKLHRATSLPLIFCLLSCIAGLFVGVWIERDQVHLPANPIDRKQLEGTWISIGVNRPWLIKLNRDGSGVKQLYDKSKASYHVMDYPPNTFNWRIVNPNKLTISGSHIDANWRFECNVWISQDNTYMWLSGTIPFTSGQLYRRDTLEVDGTEV